ncbi:uncharacterized protein RCC_09275 [Ramularia collo-cygni]|uniref:Uncharacterized protein n=1 Tax=Ramularia collo-cygni TaxID=112498 RepID=A0A2D3VH95_9PEZI|nr:uncharacterized protein RCC_09275 [Ramularia collo-cygni]CZT23561.1 uncharacterized protein RCC_09275 [Ramularia collo-cygni]
MSAGQQQHHHAAAPSKTSSDSGQQPGLDRWSQRRLQRLNTEQGFRDQRSGQVQSPPLPSTAASGSDQAPPGSSHSSSHNYAGSQYGQDAQPPPPQPLHHHPPQPQQTGYQTPRAAPGSRDQHSVGLAINTANNPSRTAQYSPPDHYNSQETPRPELTQSRSFTQQSVTADDASSMSNIGAMSAPKASRTPASNGNRQSVHSGMMSREGSYAQQGGQASAYNGGGVSQVQQYKNSQQAQPQAQQLPQQPAPGEVGRGTPQPQQPAGEEMTEEDVAQLVKDHKELREKYTKVKKYYFEKEDQVKQLQNSLAHQRLSQSRTSLDDSEYTTRFNRLDGLIAQLAFSIRKSWKSIPQWLVNSVNRDAVATGKQEMTAAGRAFISYWLVEEVFDKYFHPDLDMALSTQLKSIQKSMRKFAPVPQTAEEEEYLISKVVNWRLATLEGLQETLRSSQCPANRQKLTDLLKDDLVAAISTHLQDPAPSDLEGGVHMIIELVVSIAIHLPLESRDVAIEYFHPGYTILGERMKLESGIPPLVTSVADDMAERASMKSATSDVTDMTDANSDMAPKKRSMLSALTGTGGKAKGSGQGKHSAGDSTNSLSRPGSAQGLKEDLPPRVRMAAGISVQIRGRSVLVKAPVFST